MKTETIAALTDAATTAARRRCAAALETVAKGKRVFVKGKAAVQPYPEAGRVQLARLQRFDGRDFATQHNVATIVDGFVAAEGVTTEEAGKALLAEAVALYCTVANAVVERLFPASSS